MGSVLVVKFVFLRIEYILTEVHISVGVPAGVGGVEGGGELVPGQSGLDRVYLSQLLTLTFRVVILCNISTIYTKGCCEELEIGFGGQLLLSL